MLRFYLVSLFILRGRVGIEPTSRLSRGGTTDLKSAEATRSSVIPNKSLKLRVANFEFQVELSLPTSTLPHLPSYVSRLPSHVYRFTSTVYPFDSPSSRSLRSLARGRSGQASYV